MLVNNQPPASLERQESTKSRADLVDGTQPTEIPNVLNVDLASSLPSIEAHEEVHKEPQQRLLVFQDTAMNCAQSFPASEDEVLLEVVCPPDTCSILLARIESMQPDCVLLMLKDVEQEWFDWMARIQAEHPLPLILWVSTHSQEQMKAAHTAGVSAYWVGSSAYHNLVPNIAFAQMQHERTHAIEQELKVTQKRLDDRKWIEKAKGLIMQQNGLSEPEAFTQLRTSAMRKGITLGEISKRIISVFEDYS